MVILAPREWSFGGTLMSIFNASSLRKLESTPFTLRIQQKDSGVAITGDRFAGFRSPGPVSFSEHVQTPQSGVAAPADSLAFSAKARTFGQRMTHVLRLASEEHLDRQDKINEAYRRARQFNSKRVLNISSKPNFEIPETKTSHSRIGVPLNGAYSLSISSAPNFRSTPLQASESTSPTIEFSAPSPSHRQALQSYSAFSATPSNNSFSASL